MPKDGFLHHHAREALPQNQGALWALSFVFRPSSRFCTNGSLKGNPFGLPLYWLSHLRQVVHADVFRVRLSRQPVSWSLHRPISDCQTARKHDPHKASPIRPGLGWLRIFQPITGGPGNGRDRETPVVIYSYTLGHVHVLCACHWTSRNVLRATWTELREQIAESIPSVQISLRLRFELYHHRLSSHRTEFFN